MDPNRVSIAALKVWTNKEKTAMKEHSSSSKTKKMRISIESDYAIRLKKKNMLKQCKDWIKIFGK